MVAAGRGHKWLPHFCESTPDTVWGHYGLTPEQAARGGLNPKMFNSFLDGSKPSIESTAVANATGLGVPSNGLLYPPASVADIPFVTRPRSEGGVLERKGMVEVISSLEADGRPIPYDIRMGVWVTVEAETDYVKNCFEEYNAHTDPTGRYFTLYKRWHLIGLEVGVSVASVALRGEPTGVATAWNADVVATAKRDLRAGEVLDGEGGYTVWGKLLPAAKSHAMGGLPLGLAHQVKLKRPVAKGQSLTWDDVAMDTASRAYVLRREMEQLFTAGTRCGDGRGARSGDDSLTRMSYPRASPSGISAVKQTVLGVLAWLVYRSMSCDVARHLARTRCDARRAARAPPVRRWRTGTATCWRCCRWCRRYRHGHPRLAAARTAASWPRCSSCSARGSAWGRRAAAARPACKGLIRLVRARPQLQLRRRRAARPDLQAQARRA